MVSKITLVYNLAVQVSRGCLFHTSAAASHNLSLCHSQSELLRTIQHSVEVQEKALGSQKRVGKIREVV